MTPEETAELYAKMGEALDKIDLTPHGRMGFHPNPQFISFAKTMNMTPQQLFDLLVEDLR